MVRHAQLLLATSLLLGCFAAVSLRLPTSQATLTNDWTHEIPGMTTTPDNILVGGWGEDIAVSWWPTGSTHWYFATRDHTTHAWTQQATDIDGATFTTPCGRKLVGVGPSKWIIAGSEDCTVTSNIVVKLFYSSDNGVTWTVRAQTFSLATANGLNTNEFDMTNNGVVDNVQTLEATTSTGLRPQWRQSSDGGATWGTAVKVGNADGSPNDASCGGGVVAAQTGTAASYSMWSSGTTTIVSWGDSTTTGKQWVVKTEDGGNYWTVPYTQNCGSTTAPAATGTDTWQDIRVVNGAVAYGADATSTFSTRFNSGTTISYTCPSSLVLQKPSVRNAIPVASNGNLWMSIIRCGTTTGPTIYYSNGGAWEASYGPVVDANSNAWGFYMTPQASFFVYENVNFGGRLEVYWQQTPLRLGTPPTVDIAVSGVGAIDVDSAGHTLVARRVTGTGSEVDTYAGYNLVQTGSAATDGCYRLDGIDALYTIQGAYVVYTSCNSSGDTNAIHIRSDSLGQPAFPSGCGNECPKDIGNDNGLLALNDITIPDSIKDLADLSARPVSFTHNVLPWWDTINNNACTSFAYSTTQGTVGVWEACFIAYHSDFSRTAEATLADASNPITQLCSWVNADQDYIAGVVAGGSTGAFRVTQHLGDVFNAPTEYPAIDPVFVNGGGYGGAQSVACAKDGIFFIKGTTLYSLQVNGALTLRASRDVGQTHWQGLAASSDGNWLAVVTTDEKTHIVSASTLTEVDLITNPAGVFAGVKLDQLGANVWIATNAHITKQEIWQATTGTPQNNVYDDFGNPLPGSLPPTQDPDGDGNCPAHYVKQKVNGADKCVLDPTYGGSGSGATTGANVLTPFKGIFQNFLGDAWGWIIGLGLVAILAGAFYRQWGPGMGVLGGIVALSINVGTNLWPLWTLLLVALVAAAVLVMKFKWPR